MDGTITLKKLNDQDIPLFKKWLYLPHVAKWYHDPLDWLHEVEQRNGDYRWLHHFIVCIDGKPVGFCQYYEYYNSEETWHGNTATQGTYSIDYMIGDPSYLKKGFSKAIIRELIGQIKSYKNAERIIVQPEPENKASCNTLLSCGFHFDSANEIYVLDLTGK